MAYKIWIGVTNKGKRLIGAESVKLARNAKILDHAEQVYGSQLRYRIVAKDGQKYKITTASQANSKGLKKITRAGHWQGD